MNNHINLTGSKLTITLRFDPKLVAYIRSIDGREWNPKEKRWEVPSENVEEALKVLLPLGFVPSLAVKALAQSLKDDQARIETIKASNDQPYAGKLPLFDFQRKGASWLKAMPGALLADVPGIGKSIQTLAATEDDRKILIFCPASLKYSWEAEIKKWIPEAKIIVIEGSKKERTEAWVWARDPKFKYVIANYELLVHDHETIKDFNWGTGVCDEATRISNPSAISVRNLKTLSFSKRIALTGTPISNAPDDIFSIIDWVVPRYLGTYNQFRKKYCLIDEEWGQGRTYERIIGYQNIDQLSEKVGRFMLRRTKEEVLKDFPPKTVIDVIISLSEEERTMYDAIKERVVEEIRKLGELDTRTLGIVPVKMLRLKQCTDHTRLVDIDESAKKVRSTKLETMKEMLRGIVANGDKAIVFSQFAEMLHIMAEELEEFNPLFIYGGVSEEDRFKRVTEFNADPARKVIIMTEAGAYGLNMQAASYVFHYDAPWSIAKLQQREDRSHRHGQKKPVTVYNMIAKDTIDEYVMGVLKRKNKVSVDILKDAARMEDAGLSADDIKEILRL